MTPTSDPFSLEYPGHAFAFFSPPHWIALLILLVICSSIWFFRDWFSKPINDLRSRWIIAVLLWILLRTVTYTNLSISLVCTYQLQVKPTE